METINKIDAEIAWNKMLINSNYGTSHISLFDIYAKIYDLRIERSLELKRLERLEKINKALDDLDV